MSLISHKRKETAYFKAVSQIFNQEITNANISFVTIIEVKLSKDGSHLKIFLTFEGNIKKTLETLNGPKVKGFIRGRLSSAIKQRKTPLIHFEYDTTFEKAQKIENIIKTFQK